MLLRNELTELVDTILDVFVLGDEAADGVLGCVISAFLAQVAQNVAELLILL